MFLTKPFARFARQAGLRGRDLKTAINDADRGLVVADLGGGVIKQRVARPGAGKSGGFRVIIVLRAGDRAFFVHGFAKSNRSNIREDELTAFKLLAAQLLAYGDSALAAALKAGALMEITGDG